MSKAHTPGPWRVNTQLEGTVIWLNGSAGYELRDPTGFGHKVNPADARLIAAAPDLLLAAKAMVAGGYVMDFESREWLALEAAIKRAEEGDA